MLIQLAEYPLHKLCSNLKLVLNSLIVLTGHHDPWGEAEHHLRSVGAKAKLSGALPSEGFDR
jgi:hypothetical protein